MKAKKWLTLAVTGKYVSLQYKNVIFIALCISATKNKNKKMPKKLEKNKSISVVEKNQEI